MTRTHYHFVAVLVLLLTTVPIWAQVGVQAQMSDVKGKVSLVRGTSSPTLLHKHDNVQAGDEILTDHKSSATVRMPDGSTVHLYPDSRVVLHTETGNWKEFLYVLLGNVRVQIEKLSGRPNPKTVTTPTAIIAVRGTIFAVAVNQVGDTQVGVEKGLVSVANLRHPEDEVTVRPGQSCWVRQSQRPTQPQKMMQPMPGMMDSGMSGMRMPGGMSRPGGMGPRR